MIFYNLDSKETKMDFESKKHVFNELSDIIESINTYDNQQLLKILERIKRKYSSLILKLDNDNQGDIKSLDTTEILFSDLNLDESPSQVPCANYQSNENGTEDYVEQKDKDMKDKLINLCNQILNMLDNNEDSEFVSYLHSIIVWSNVTPELKSIDFSSKIDEIEINYNKYQSIEKVVDYKDELVKLCQMLLNDINQNTLPMGQVYCNALKDYVNNIVGWIKQQNYANNDIEFKNKIEKLNIKCEELYELSQN